MAALLAVFAILCSAPALAEINCSGLTLNNYTQTEITKQLGGGSSVGIAQKHNYSFSGTCTLFINSGVKVPVAVPTTIEAEVTGANTTFLAAESVKFSYAGQTFALTTLSTCDHDPLSYTFTAVTCSSQNFTGAPPLGQLSNSDVPFAKGRGTNANNILLNKLGTDQKLWYNTPTAKPVVISPQPGETINPKAMKIQIKLPDPHPQWQTCCDIGIIFKATNGMNGIGPSNLKINASTAQGNTIYVDIADMLDKAKAGNGVLAGQNFNHAEMQLYVTDSVDNSVKIANDPSVVPQHNSQEQQVLFYLPRLSLGLGGTTPAAPVNPYTAKPVIASPVAGTSYTGDVFIRAQTLAKELTDDGYTCCKIEFERKNAGIWSIFTPPANIYSSKIDSNGIGVSLGQSGDYRVKLLTFAPAGGAFFAASDWVEFKFTQPGTPAGKAGGKPGVSEGPGLDAPKFAPQPAAPDKPKK